MMYLIHVDGQIVSQESNVNFHQINLESWLAQGEEPIESRIKND